MTGGGCPSCGKPIDPLRAPIARVVDGRIRTFCSPACAAGAPAAVAPSPSGPSAVPRERAPQPSAPIITIVEEPDDADAPPARADGAERRRRNRRVAWLTAGIVAGGMAVVVIQTVSPSSPSRVAAERDGAGGAAPPPPVAAAIDAAGGLDVRDPDAVRARAIEDLRALLVVPEEGRVPRIAREAARALSRTGDAAALEVLARSLEDEPSEIAKVEVAYALARGGDARGVRALVAALRSPRRDVRADAGRLLVLLGDRRGIDPLEAMLGMSQLRLGAAEALAPMQHPRALGVLEAVRADERAPREDRLRALVALGAAGKQDAADELRGLLADPMQNVGAARALARLGDAAAAPVLARLLSVPSLQVEAALGLRRLDPDGNVTAHLPALVTALDSGKDTTRVSAAEAILVLTGPAAVAERD